MDNADEVIASRFRRLYELRQERDITESRAKTANKEYRDYEAELYEEMLDSPIKGTRKFDLGEPFGVVTFSPRETIYGRVLDQEQAMEYFESRGRAQEMATPKISKARLNELVKDHIEQGKPPPPGIDWYASRGITISKKK